MTEPLFIAEVSSNHHKDIKRCLQFVDVAAEIGCGAVKFQLFKIEELFASEVLIKRPELMARREWELPISFLPDIWAQCKKRNIQFSCTPFYLRAVDVLSPYVEFYKIASYELLWDDLLSACGQTGKPVILSTGMATMAEVERAFDILVKSGCSDITFLHCVSGYPTPVPECNLAVIDTLRKRFHNSAPRVIFHAGWSDHSVDPGVIHRAVSRWSAHTIEFHLDLDGKGEEFSTGHCWLPGQIAPVISEIRKGFLADGDGEKRTASSELPEREWRADPIDGLRPLRIIRARFSGS